MVTPQEINRALDSVSPYIRKNLQSNFQGLEVSWELSYFDITEFSLVFTIPGIFHSLLVFAKPVDLTKYPRFKTLERGSIVLVKGVIAELRLNDIHLEKCDFDFKINATKFVEPIKSLDKSSTAGDPFQKPYTKEREFFTMNNPVVYFVVIILLALLYYLADKYKLPLKFNF